MNAQKTFNLILIFIFAFSLLGMPARVAAQEPPPSIGVVPNVDAVYLWNWKTGANVTLTIDAIRNGIPINYSTSMLVPEFDMVFYVGNAFDIQVGDVVMVSDGITTKTVTASNVRILGINLDTDTVIGMADPLDTIRAYIYGNCSSQQQDVTANDNGVWYATFAGCNFNDSTRITAAEEDFGTLFEFYVPYFSVNSQDNKVDGFKWLLGNLVTLTIDDPVNGVGIDYAETKTVPSSDWDRNQTYISFDLGTFKIHPGDLVTMTDGITTKTAIVENLILGGGSVINDRVWGTADPGAVIQVFNRDNPNVYRNVNTDVQGNWTADFSVPGDGQPSFDIQPGNVMFADQKDEDGDRTHVEWHASSPPEVTGVIDADGGTLTTENGKVFLTVPAGAMTEPISFSITTGDSGYEVAGGTLQVVNSYSIEPHGTVFNPPATLTFRWDDANNDGIVDGTTLLESSLVLIKDGAVITPPCGDNPDCNMDANTLTVHISSLSLFELAAPNNRQLTALSTAKVWIGLKNSDDVGTKFDLLAEVYQNKTIIGSGQLNKVISGSSGFNNAKFNTIPLTLFTPISLSSGSTLNIKLYIRNTCYGNTHNSGTARLWYNDSSANSNFGATIDGVGIDYFLRDGFNLSTIIGNGPRKTIDVAAGKPCSSFKLLGTWTITP